MTRPDYDVFVRALAKYAKVYRQKAYTHPYGGPRYQSYITSALTLEAVTAAIAHASGSQFVEHPLNTTADDPLSARVYGDGA